MFDFPQAPAIRVLLVDDDAVVRDGLKRLIESRAALAVVGEAANAAAAVAAAGRLRPDVVVLDLDLQNDSGLDAIGSIRAAAKTNVLVLTTRQDAEMHDEVVRRGVRGIVLKERAADLLLRAIEHVNRGDLWLDRATMGRLLAKVLSGDQIEVQGKIHGLTAREREIVVLISQGLKNAEIAARLGVDEAVVRDHELLICEKLGVEDRLALVVYAFQHGLVRAS